MLFIMAREWLLPIVRPSSEALQEKEVLFMKYLSSLNAPGPSGKSIKATIQTAAIFRTDEKGKDISLLLQQEFTNWSPMD